MALALRLSRGGRKNLPHYSIVVADKRYPRDGRFLEKLGTYNPLLGKEDPKRVQFNEERVKYWLGQGAQPSDRIAIFLGKAGVIPMPARKNNPQKAVPSDKTKMRIAEKAEKVKAAAEAAEQAKAEAEEAKKAAAAAAAEAAAAPAPEEAPAEAAAEAPAEESKAE